ncbi:hypothetical protein IJ556_00680 [bacterium]|nr:hypothetical protein [bacterium]MBR2273867.1 hypothetical protein [Alphaproteobacteria bacterium]
MLKYLLLLLTLMASTTTLAQENEPPVELQNFEAYADILPFDEYGEARGTKRSLRQLDIIPFIQSQIKAEAAYNIMNPEQVFCYHVTRQPQNYTGYTLNKFAIAGYCGELDNSQMVTTYEALFTKGINILTQKADCRIEPRIMLRFVRGVDYTDVLLSSPCPSFTVFYAGRYNSFNIKQGVINDIISQLETKNESFHSPALLKQTVANGIAKTTAEEELLEKKQQEQQPIMNWQHPQQQEQTESEPDKKPITGWGKLNLRLKNQE